MAGRVRATQRKKAHRHPNDSLKAPPTSGPAAIEAAIAALHTPERPAPLGALELLCQKRQRAGEQRRPAHALGPAGEVEDDGLPGETAQQRGEEKPYQSPDKDTLAAQPVGQGARGLIVGPPETAHRRL